MDLLFRRKGTEISGFRMITCRRVVTLCIKSTLSLDIIQNRYTTGNNFHGSGYFRFKLKVQKSIASIEFLQTRHIFRF